ncbi:MAG: hypothetical protein NTW26_03780 [bacterium]|nr:hypothetical protein [bacterium]
MKKRKKSKIIVAAIITGSATILAALIIAIANSPKNFPNNTANNEGETIESTEKNVSNNTSTTDYLDSNDMEETDFYKSFGFKPYPEEHKLEKEEPSLSAIDSKCDFLITDVISYGIIENIVRVDFRIFNNTSSPLLINRIGFVVVDVLDYVFPIEGGPSGLSAQYEFKNIPEYNRRIGPYDVLNIFGDFRYHETVVSQLINSNEVDRFAVDVDMWDLIEESDEVDPHNNFSIRVIPIVVTNLGIATYTDIYLDY